MPRIRVKLKELTNATVDYVSIVNRAASRIPFRVLKHSTEESEMKGIDLTKIFKGDTAVEVKPEVAALVVFAQKSDALTDEVRQSIAAAGFTTDRAIKAENEETVVYKQDDKADETVVVRLSDETCAVVRNMPPAPGFYAEVVKENGFYPGLGTALGALYDRMETIVQKSEKVGEEIRAAIIDFNAYADQLLTLPVNVFKADAAINAAVAQARKAEAEQAVKTEETTATVTEETKTEEPKVEETAQKTEEYKSDSYGDCAQCMAMKQEGVPEAEIIAAHKAGHKAKKDETPEPVVEPQTVVKAEQIDAIMQAIAGLQSTFDTRLSDMTQKVDSLGEQVTSVVQKQSEQEKALDAVVKKAETVEQRLGTTLTAPPPVEDKPAAGDETVTKGDDDPRTGAFDTAFLRRRR